MSKPKIVILGGGYGGLITSRKLEKLLNSNEAEVTLINKHEYHYITTQLHKTGSGTATDDKITLNISEVLKTNKINFKKATISSINFENQQVLLETGENIDYDYLVLSLGFDVNTFGIPGIEEHAFKIRSFRSTKAIYHHILHQFEEYQIDQDPSRLTFAVAGAGFTGIEMIGELVEAIPGLCKKYNIPIEETRIVNIEASNSVLPGFAKRAVDFTTNYVKKHRVELMTNTKIIECTSRYLKLDNGINLPARTLIWSGGVRGNRLLEKLPLPIEKSRVKVDSYLRVHGRDNVFCIGDAALCMKNETEALPPTAQVAIQQAETCAPNLVAAIRGDSLTAFKYSHKGTVASIGTTAAVGNVFGVKITGLFAAFMKQVVEARYLLVLGGPSLLLKQLSKIQKPYHQVSLSKTNK